MNTPITLRLSGLHHAELMSLLFSDDGNEAVAIALCGRHTSASGEVLCVHEVHAVPAEEYADRSPLSVTWGTDWLLPHLMKAEQKKWAVIKVHSHPTGMRAFSATDDDSDQRLFPSIHGWTEDVAIHASAVMLPDGDMIARGVLADGSFVPVTRVLIAGDLIRVIDDESWDAEDPAWSSRHAQALGSSTSALLRKLRIGVVGSSGTGSFVVETLARLGVGELVLVDPETIEEENLNRIIWASRDDIGLTKVEVAQRHVLAMGLGTTPIPIPLDLAHATTIEALAKCDVVVGCVDSHDGRQLLNRLATFYVIPYLDVGVRLDADGGGGVEHISGAVHYVQPGGSSLLSRGVINSKMASAQAMHRADPDGYAERRDQGYLRGVDETRPAVVSINGMFACMGVNELLARLHGFRGDDHMFSQQRFILSDPLYNPVAESEPCPSLVRHVGRGDVTPLLDLPALSVHKDNP